MKSNNIQNERYIVSFLTGCLFYMFILILVLAAPCSYIYAQSEQKPELSISFLPPNTVQITGDISVNDRFRLYSREYSSSDHIISDKLLSETMADTDGSASLRYDPYSVPLSEVRISPDFDYKGREISIKALYAVVSDGHSEI